MYIRSKMVPGPKRIQKLEECPLLQSSGARCADALHTARDDRSSSGCRQAIQQQEWLLCCAALLRKWVYSYIWQYMAIATSITMIVNLKLIITIHIYIYILYHNIMFAVVVFRKNTHGNDNDSKNNHSNNNSNSLYNISQLIR